MAETSELAQYTYAEVSKHNGRNGERLWIVYKDQVFDVTNFLQEHPGGVESIQENAGKDATRDFEDVGHSKDAIKIMLTYRIGEIVQEERKENKKRKVPADPSITKNNRSFFNIVTCGLLG